MKTTLFRSLMLMLLLGTMVISCKKEVVLTTPVPVAPLTPSPITIDSRPVNGDFQFFFTDPALKIGMYRRYSIAKIDVIVSGPKSPKGYLTDITSAFYSNPNTQDWIGATFKDGYPTVVTTSKGYLLEFKNYSKTAKSVDITISQSGKLVKQLNGQSLGDSFFESTNKYGQSAKPLRIGSFSSACADAKELADALGFVSSAVGCAVGAAAVASGIGAAAIMGSGVGILSSCFSAVDYLVGKSTGTSLTERAVGKDLAPAVKLALDFMGGRLPNPTGWLGEGAEMYKNMNDFLGGVGTFGDLAGAVPCGDPAHSTGDPHITTLDGLHYGFQGHGEFIVTKSSVDNFEVQVRQEDVKNTGKATMNTAVAIQTGTDKVVVTANPDRLFINNQTQDLATFTSLALKEGASVAKVKEGGYTVVNVYYKTGDLVKVRFHGSYLLDYSLYVSESHKSKVEGITGNYDGNKDNDVQIRNGNVLSGQSAGIKFKDLYPTFADSWRITQANSLFYYDASKNTDSYTDKNFPRTAENLTADQKAKAEATCRAAGVTTEPFLSNCIFDVAITGDPALASSSLWGQQSDARPPSLPVPIIQEAVDVKTINTHNDGSFVLKADGTLWVAGWSRHGQFGIGKNYYEFDTKNYFVKIMDGIKDIASGSGNHMLFLKNDNSVWAAGYNSEGQIGNGATNGDNVLTAVKIMDNGRVLATSEYSSFVIKNDNTLWAFGRNDSGVLGDGTTKSKYVPVKIMDNVKAVAAGYMQTLILKTDNTLWGCGSALYGGLGVPQVSPFDRVTPFKLMDDVLTMASGRYHSLVIKTDNTLWVSGDNYDGQLGIGTNGSGTSLFKFTKVTDNVAAAAAGDVCSFILKTDNTLWATGSNADGQFGNGTKTSRTTFGQVASAIKYVVTYGGTLGSGGMTFIVKTDNTLWGTGKNVAGCLGDGTDTPRLTFVPINVK